MRRIDIAPFALPDAPDGEFWFEETRDIEEIEIAFRGRPPRAIGVLYRRRLWPQTRFETRKDTDDPAAFGWLAMDDWFNGDWQEAAVEAEHSEKAVIIRFAGLSRDGVGEVPASYDVGFRRTLAVKIVVPEWNTVRGVRICTRSMGDRSALRVELDAGHRTPGTSLGLSAYNAVIARVRPVEGVTARKGGGLELAEKGRRVFSLDVNHMSPAHRYCHDEGMVTFACADDTFTVSLEDLRKGPVWCEAQGVYITREDAALSFREYRARSAGAATMRSRVSSHGEQSFAGSFFGQPRPHADACSVGCKYSPQRFWIEPNGDVLLHKRLLVWLDSPAPLAGRFRSADNALFQFGFESWIPDARFMDPAPVPVYHLRFRRDALLAEYDVLCVPVTRPITGEELSSSDVLAALVRIRYRNAGNTPAAARLPIGFTEHGERSQNAFHADSDLDDSRVRRRPLAPLTAETGRLTSTYDGRPVLRAFFEADMEPAAEGDLVVLRKDLPPGEGCGVLLKIPYVELESPLETEALHNLDYDRCSHEVSAFWRAEALAGAQLHTPVPQLDALHASHLVHVQTADVAMPDDPTLINTSVGTSTYGNFANESCMIIHELDQRGLAREAERRLNLWVKYQGTKKQPGNFTDFDGMYFGAGGFEEGAYNQHHGWVLWCMSEHYLLTGDRAWFDRVADSMIAGADWVFRQRRETKKNLPRSRGWEKGFLPAGSLEDVTDFWYWLSTNCFTWRGVEYAARALEKHGHPQASRVRREADAYRADLVDGLEMSRRNAPLVALRDGRWVPHFPSRLYCRGRDLGWIREALEGPVNALIAGLFAPDSPQARWILDDYLDNLYHVPPYGYMHRDFDATWWARGGFSIQPCLLAGLLPHLERDEIEVFLWMFFNAWAAIYRQEIGGMVEHPMPELGFSNAAVFKTSDEANAVAWLRCLLVHDTDAGLFLGRAVPRRWMRDGETCGITGAVTHYGTVAVRFESRARAGLIRAEAQLDLRDSPPLIRLSFRHPEKKPLAGVTVNGATWQRFDPTTGNVDLSGLSGKIEAAATYGGKQDSA